MAKKIKDNPQNYPWLGRVFLWVDQPGSATKLFGGLAVVCLMLGLADFLYEKHGHFTFENLPAFYGLFGFVAFSCVIFGAKALRELIKRPEDFYAPHVIDTEEYPEDELEKVAHDAD